MYYLHHELVLFILNYCMAVPASLNPYNKKYLSHNHIKRLLAYIKHFSNLMYITSCLCNVFTSHVIHSLYTYIFVIKATYLKFVAVKFQLTIINQLTSITACSVTHELCMTFRCVIAFLSEHWVGGKWSSVSWVLCLSQNQVLSSISVILACL